MKAPQMTPEEQTNVRAALRFLRARFGGWLALARTLGVSRSTAKRADPGPVLAFRVARLAGVGVDAVLSGAFPSPGTCPNCGHVQETGPAGGAS